MTVQELLEHIAQLQKQFPDVDVMKAEVTILGQKYLARNIEYEAEYWVKDGYVVDIS